MDAPPDKSRARYITMFAGELTGARRLLATFKQSTYSMATLPIRRVARLLVLDSAHSVLLVRYQEYRADRSGSFWATPGGELEHGEGPREAAMRELLEETGLSVTVGRELWRKNFRFELPQGWVDQEERYFLARLAEVSPQVHNSSSEAITEHRWWSLAELQSTTEVIYPDGLASDLEALLDRGAT